MRLNTIKLSGFKSFVDPTTIHFSRGAAAIVGPNGCGKSNIVDAILWVLGESSSKSLRSDTLADVIFNGSSTRKPVGQASAELIFDNADGKIGGTYAGYTEISVKRKISRDGDSKYFLNGTHCRRRDVINLLSGTGLGRNHYAIIQQGSVSRLIEAKKEEIRLLIEEAAGISKYREKRHETEIRINHTHENMARLNEIRNEIQRQLDGLQKQLEAADKYRRLKEKQHRLEKEFLLFQWQQLNTKRLLRQAERREKETLLAKISSQSQQLRTEIEEQRTLLGEAQQTLQCGQQHFYQAGADVSQIEQQMRHHKERIERLKDDLADCEEARKTLNDDHTHDRQQLALLEHEEQLLVPQAEQDKTEEANLLARVNEFEEQQADWQLEWDALNEQASQHDVQLQLSRSRLAELNRRETEVVTRHNELANALAKCRIAIGSVEIDQLRSDITSGEVSLSELTRALEKTAEQLKAGRAQLVSDGQALEQQRLYFTRLEERLLALKAQHQNQLGRNDQSVVAWLKKHGLDTTSPLLDRLSIEAHWVHALEIVLGDYLHSLCVLRPESYLIALQELTHGRVALIELEENSKEKENTPISAQRLSGVVNLPQPLATLVENIYVAADSESAVALSATLPAAASVITTEGFWVGHGWIRYAPSVETSKGVLSTRLNIEEIETKLLAQNKEIKEKEVALSHLNRTVSEQEITVSRLNEQTHACAQDLSALRERLAIEKSREDQEQTRITQLNSELNHIEEERQNINDAIHMCAEEEKTLASTYEQFAERRAVLVRARDHHQHVLRERRDAWEAFREEHHAKALRLEAIRSSLSALRRSVEKNTLRFAELDQRTEKNNQELLGISQPLSDLKMDLDKQLQGRLGAEQELKEARARVQKAEELVRSSESEYSQRETQLQQERDKVTEAQLQEKEIQVTSHTIEEALNKIGVDIAEMEPAPTMRHTETDVYERELTRLENSIEKLGAVNLVAAEEYQQLFERKEHLDTQYTDLEVALATLKEAITTIDRESEALFQKTFDALNEKFSQVFPVVFGGGHASLEAVGDGALNAGVLVHVQPPGKRNRTIQSLSGGEKALSAVALIFSIFSLNPAPFCILDEVDAPLDDVNVVRFMQLLKQMAEAVQFIFITHNKITMHDTQQLIGVTMQEAGVSRIVSVDIDEAMEMAAASG